MKTTLTVHATNTPPTEKLTARDIDRRDRAFGYSELGYHFVIERGGKIVRGRDPAAASVHDEIGLARTAVSVCLVGGANAKGEPADNFTHEQWDAFETVVKTGSFERVVAIAPSLKGKLKHEVR